MSAGEPVTNIKLETADSDSNDVVDHIRDEPRPYVCTVCERRFKYKGSLESHVRAHETATIHRCNTCNKQFVSEGRLLRHRATHAAERRGSDDENKSAVTRQGWSI